MKDSRRNFLTLMGGISALIPMNMKNPLNRLMSGLANWGEVASEFDQYCSSDLYTFRDPGCWQARSPLMRNAATVYRVHVVLPSPQRMSAMQYYNYLKSVMNLKATDQDTEKRLRSGDILAVDYRFAQGRGQWTLDFKNESAYYDFLATAPNPKLAFERTELGWVQRA